MHNQTVICHALKHGLARSIRRDPAYDAIVDGLAKLLAGSDATWFRTYKANRLAEAVVGMQRLAAAEIAIINNAALKFAAGSSAPLGSSTYVLAIACSRDQLLRLERYRRAAFVDYLRTFRAYLLELEKEKFG